MKIAGFNINNINRRLPNLLSWLREAAPDIVCLQELKAAAAENFSQGNPAGRLSRRVAQRDALERRRNPRAMAPVMTRLTCKATPTTSNATTSKQPLMGCCASIYAPNGNP